MSDIDNINPPNISNELGTLHPINQTKDFLLRLLSNMGFEEVHGPEIETEEFNFDMLNIKKSHPARQMHDTFYVENKKNVLRTHTSPVQIRSMLISKPPIAFTSARLPGAWFGLPKKRSGQLGPSGHDGFGQRTS
jgi:phenylalanyl-tRNA synthetase alpha chain